VERIDSAEEILRGFGIRMVRVRSHGDTARIETAAEERSKFFDIDFLDTITREFRELRYRYVCLDIEGYRTGKMNRTNEYERD
jgi:uncharacterized protein